MSELAPGRKVDRWDRELECGLPESRRSTDRDTVYMAGKLWQRVYCVDCGRFQGGVTPPSYFDHTFFLCDPCNERAVGLIAAPLPDPVRFT